MSTLRLVKDRTPDFCALIEAVEGLLGNEASSSGGHMEISRSTYSGLLAIYIENLDNGASCRIIFDPNRVHAGRQGMHTTLEIDEYQVCDNLDEAYNQGFDTIWVHV